jgi:hypothetical protein
MSRSTRRPSQILINTTQASLLTWTNGEEILTHLMQERRCFPTTSQALFRFSAFGVSGGSHTKKDTVKLFYEQNMTIQYFPLGKFNSIVRWSANWTDMVYNQPHSQELKPFFF